MRRTVFLVLAALLLLTGVALANGAPTADWHILGGGGGHVEATPYALNGTIGQAVVGMATDTDCELCSGFWCAAAAEYRVYLPLVLRGYS